MKKLILSIFENPSDRDGIDILSSSAGVCTFKITSSEDQHQDQNTVAITLKFNSYNIHGYDILKELFSEENELCILTVKNEKSMTVQEMYHKNEESFKDNPFPAKYSLTRQQRLIMEHLSKGLQYKEVAAELGISYHTVKNHISNIYNKMEVRNVCEAIDLFSQYRKGMN